MMKVKIKKRKDVVDDGNNLYFIQLILIICKLI